MRHWPSDTLARQVLRKHLRSFMKGDTTNLKQLVEGILRSLKDGKEKKRGKNS